MTRCARPQAKKDSLFPQELLKTPSWQQKGPQISIINYVKNWNHRQSAIEAHQQDKARRTEPHQQDKARIARGTRAKPLTLDTTHNRPPAHTHTHTHTARKGLSPRQKGSTVPTGAINNPLRTAKAATNGNHRLKLTRRINPERQAAPARGALDLTQPTIPPPPSLHSPERTEDCFNKHDCNFDNGSKIG